MPTLWPKGLAMELAVESATLLNMGMEWLQKVRSSSSLFDLYFLDIIFYYNYSFIYILFTTSFNPAKSLLNFIHLQSSYLEFQIQILFVFADRQKYSTISNLKH